MDIWSFRRSAGTAGQGSHVGQPRWTNGSGLAEVTNDLRWRTGSRTFAADDTRSESYALRCGRRTNVRSIRFPSIVASPPRSELALASHFVILGSRGRRAGVMTVICTTRCGDVAPLPIIKPAVARTLWCVRGLIEIRAQYVRCLHRRWRRHSIITGW